MMNLEELNTALYEKMFAGQERFANELKTQPPEEDRAMLKLDAPLSELFKEWDNQETTYMDRIWDVFSDKAGQQAKEAAKSDCGQER